MLTHGLFHRYVTGSLCLTALEFAKGSIVAIGIITTRVSLCRSRRKLHVLYGYDNMTCMVPFNPQESAAADAGVHCSIQWVAYDGLLRHLWQRLCTRTSATNADLGNTSGASAVLWVLSCPMPFVTDVIIFQLVGGVSFSTSTAEEARV